MPFDDVQVDIETEVHPTESEEKVRHAVNNIFPGAVFDGPKDGLLRATARGVSGLRHLLAVQHIRDAARSVLWKARREGHIYLSLSKQAAYAGRASFSEDGPLGDIVVIVRTSDPDGLVDLLTVKEDGDEEDDGEEEDRYEGFPEE